MSLVQVATAVCFIFSVAPAQVIFIVTVTLWYRCSKGCTIRPKSYVCLFFFFKFAMLHSNDVVNYGYSFHQI